MCGYTVLNIEKVCASSYVCAAQTTRRHCHLQTVCFFEDVSLKRSTQPLPGVDLDQPLLRFFKQLITQQPTFSIQFNSYLLISISITYA
ncbi:hypothetical protein QVD17_23798 [Tagetes erecta]|uniref:Uncharacterized protein n=1 Tax=Tagetes erecta TaxID=13708 RepID=A0AAD8KEE0_TARER|nr:hypothetical protein QVD17_23798 [Tagetes erecta]